jgi:hypothetical protein
MVGSRGPYRFEVIDSSLTSADTEPVIRTYQLFQNYPNPFNPVTTLRYTIPVSSYVTVTVYSVVGQEVVDRLFSGDQESGSYTVVWDAGRYPSGVYFFRLQATGLDAGSFVGTRKALLLK